MTPASVVMPGHSRAPLAIALAVSTLGGLLFGYDNIVISGAIGYLAELCFIWTPQEWAGPRGAR